MSQEENTTMSRNTFSTDTRTIHAALVVDARMVQLDRLDPLLARAEEQLRRDLGLAAAETAKVHRTDHPSGVQLRASLTLTDNPAPDLDALTAHLVDKLTAVFGAEPTVASQLAKLREETQEFLSALELPEPEAGEEALRELADMVVVCCTMAHVCGYSVPDLFDEVMAKAQRNARRSWGHSGDGVSARHTEEG